MDESDGEMWKEVRVFLSPQKREQSSCSLEEIER